MFEAKDIDWPNWIQAAAAVITIPWVIAAWRAAKRQANAADRQAVAADKQAAAADSTANLAIKQLYAQIASADKATRPVIEFTDHPGPANLTYIKNVGLGPALDIYARYTRKPNDPIQPITTQTTLGTTSRMSIRYDAEQAEALGLSIFYHSAHNTLVEARATLEVAPYGWIYTEHIINTPYADMVNLTF